MLRLIPLPTIRELPLHFAIVFTVQGMSVEMKELPNNIAYSPDQVSKQII